MALIKRNTAYSLNDIVYTTFGIQLKCTTAGTTSTDPLILDGTSPITDGTVVWEVLVDGITYSTQEQRIGTWTDGKPLYQKTIVDTMPTTTTTGTRVIKNIDINNLYVKNLIKLDGYCVYNNNTSVCCLNSLLRGDSGQLHYSVLQVVKVDSTKQHFDSISLGNVSVWLNNFPVYITIQYTKTTD